EHCLNLDMEAEPGEYWHYNTGASHLLSAIVQQATGMTTLEFGVENLFDPLGIDSVYWSRDRAGWYKGGFDLRMSTLNAAKFGYLFLNNGTWDGDQIISAEWVNASTTTITQINDLEGYAKQWWTFPELGIYFAAGLYGQYIYVVPEHDIVVAFNSRIGQGDYYPHHDLVIDYILQSTNEVSEAQNLNNILMISIAIAIVVPTIIAGVYWLQISKRRKS
ncbi:MAG: serine hydrolase domain-containing protein, partial [Candidatus Thorarchaeota archaeon]